MSDFNNLRDEFVRAVNKIVAQHNLNPVARYKIQELLHKFCTTDIKQLSSLLDLTRLVYGSLKNYIETEGCELGRDAMTIIEYEIRFNELIEKNKTKPTRDELMNALSTSESLGFIS